MKKVFDRALKRRGLVWKDIFLIGGSFVFLLGGLFTLWVANLKIPDFTGVEDRKITESTKIFDRTGKILLYDIHENVKRTIVESGDISRHIKNATVAIEDAEFYEHVGVKPKAFLRAVLVNLGSLEFSQGGSTITQQVVKNSILTQEKTIARKIKEWVLAVKLERVMDKDEILTLYLNESPYGGSMYGVEQASRVFFGKSANEVNLAESAYLAALPQAPSYYSPYGNNRDALERRKNLVLDRMKTLGFISEQEYEEAKNEEVLFSPQENIGIKAPHFVFYVRSYLEEKYGKDVVERGGLVVTTTLDWSLQEKAERIVKEYALKNEKDFNAENASLVAIDPKTGQILSLVGSRDYFDKEIDGSFNAALGKRQPGSAFKPFVYATAFKRGFTPETVLFDLPTEFETRCTPEGKPKSTEINPEDCYTPENYDGKYRGPMSLREALAQSINIPAIKTLHLAGIRESLQTARDFGITTLSDPDRYGLTLVLGGGEVTVLELASAYSVFGNDGVRNPHTPILSVKNASGETLESFSPKPTRAIDENISRQISDILSDDVARQPTFGANSPLHFPGRDVAVKTGTTNDYRDVWIAGYTPSLAVAAWAGNNDNTSMERRVAGLIIAPMWNAFMREALSSFPTEEFPSAKDLDPTLPPALRGFWLGGETYVIDSASGKLATDRTPPETRVEKPIQNVHSILYWIDRKNPHSGKPENPNNDAQFEYWEYPIRKWALQNGFTDQTNIGIPTEYDDVHVEKNIPVLSLLSPSLKTISRNERMYISFSSKSTYPISRADYYLNGSFVGSSKNSPFSFSLTPGEFANLSEINTVRIDVYDLVFNKQSLTFSFTLTD